MRRSTAKIKTGEELKNILLEKRKSTQRIVTTNGVFDILHPGHVQYLEEAKSLGDILVVGINSDASVRKIKGQARPINNEKDRLQCVAALESVDYVVLFTDTTPITLLEQIKPNIHIKGGDYKGQEEKIAEKQTVEKNGGKVILVNIKKGYSTTNTIHKIKEQ